MKVGDSAGKRFLDGDEEEGDVDLHPFDSPFADGVDVVEALRAIVPDADVKRVASYVNKHKTETTAWHVPRLVPKAECLRPNGTIDTSAFDSRDTVMFDPESDVGIVDPEAKAKGECVPCPHGGWDHAASVVMYKRTPQLRYVRGAHANDDM